MFQQKGFTEASNKCPEATSAGQVQQAGQSGIGSDALQRARFTLQKRLADLEYQAQQVREALADTEDPAVQRVLRIFELA